MLKKSTPIYDRFISMKVLAGLVRPQAPAQCSIAAIAAAVNALYGRAILPDDVLKATNWDLEDDVEKGNIGNKQMIEGFQSVCRYVGVYGKADIIFNQVPKNKKEAEKSWETIKKEIKNSDTVLVYHAYESYGMIAGYFEEPWDESCIGSNSYLNRRDWLLFAENFNDPGRGPRAKDPIQILDWGDLLVAFEKENFYGVLRFRKTRKGKFAKKTKATKTKHFRKIETAPGGLKKTLWNGTKSEFALKILEELENDKIRKPRKYKSLQDVTHKLFNTYSFNDPNWTKEKCYDLVRKH